MRDLRVSPNSRPVRRRKSRQKATINDPSSIQRLGGLYNGAMLGTVASGTAIGYRGEGRTTYTYPISK